MSLGKFKRTEGYPQHPITDSLLKMNEGYKELEKSYGKWTGYPLALMIKKRNELNKGKRRYEKFKSKYAPFVIGILLGIIIGLLCK